MNREQLREKWSKYCDTDKLVVDTMALLKTYHHKNTEDGVCAMLDRYFTKKEHLIKLIATSNHYIGNMRIAIKSDWERDVDRYAIQRFVYGFPKAIDAEKFFMRFEDDDGNVITDYLKAAQKKVNIKEFKVDEENTKKIKQFDYSTGATHKSNEVYTKFCNHSELFAGYYSPTMYTDIKDLDIVKGTKTSRAFNKMCVHYGIDKAHPQEIISEENGKTVKRTVYPYDKLFAQYSDLVSTSTRKLYFIISLNPLDYLTMSIGKSWTSCHSINGDSRGNSGGWSAGCLSYMLDESSIITFVVDKLNDEVHKEGKIYRQMFYYKDKAFIQSRLYPQGNDGALNLYDKFRGLMQDEFNEILNLTDTSWEYKGGTSVIRNHCSDNGFHYRDHTAHNQCGIFYPKERKNINGLVVRIGSEAICPCCGRVQTDYRNRLAHTNC